MRYSVVEDETGTWKPVKQAGGKFATKERAEQIARVRNGDRAEDYAAPEVLAVMDEEIRSRAHGVAGRVAVWRETPSYDTKTAIREAYRELAGMVTLFEVTAFRCGNKVHMSTETAGAYNNATAAVRSLNDKKK